MTRKLSSIILAFACGVFYGQWCLRVVGYVLPAHEDRPSVYIERDWPNASPLQVTHD